MIGGVALRPATDDDLPFLFDVYASTRAEELSVTGWDDVTKDAFLRQQFDAQHRSYHQAYPDGSFDVILVEDEAAGRLYVARLEREIRIVDIALLPPFRGRGIGTDLVLDVMAEAAGSGRTVRIHVERQNRARLLYERLGFHAISEDGVYELMEALS